MHPSVSVSVSKVVSSMTARCIALISSSFYLSQLSCMQIRFTRFAVVSHTLSLSLYPSISLSHPFLLRLLSQYYWSGVKFWQRRWLYKLWHISIVSLLDIYRLPVNVCVCVCVCVYCRHARAINEAAGAGEEWGAGTKRCYCESFAAIIVSKCKRSLNWGEWELQVINQK